MVACTDVWGSWLEKVVVWKGSVEGSPGPDKVGREACEGGMEC